MKKTNGKQTIQDIFDLADVRINGNRPWDIQVRNQSFYERVLAGGSLSLGETYMDGWWDCEALDQFFYKMWTYYLLSCAGSFRARRNQLWQIVFSKKGIQGGYQSICE